MRLNQETSEQDNMRRVTDLAIATTIALSHPIEAIIRDNPRKASFVFRGGAEIDDIIKRYWKGEIRVEPQNYFNELRSIKARLYSEYGRPGQ